MTAQTTLHGYMIGLDEKERKIIIPCKSPGLSCCLHQLKAPHHPDNNVIRCEVYCMRWRVNRMRDKVFCKCDPEFGVKEDA